MAQELTSNATQNDIQTVRTLVGRSAQVVVQEGKFQGKRGVVVTGIVGGKGTVAAEVCVRLSDQSARLKLPLTAVREVDLVPVRETVVSRLIHQLGYLIPTLRR